MLTLKIFNLQLENQFTTLFYIHIVPGFLMERGCNIHVLEYFDKLPRKNVSLS